MAQDKGKNIVTGLAPAPPMNPPPWFFPFPVGERHGCDGDDCASDPATWPLYDAIRGGVQCRLCCSCILLSHRSLYCCRCFFLVTSPSSHYDAGDTLMAPPVPTMTCQYCLQAVAHVLCLYHELPADGVFVCPPCTAALNGRRFTYAPPCGQPIDERNARVLVIATRMSLALMERHAAAAREAAERKAREARDARARAIEALSIAHDLANKEGSSWFQPKPHEENDDLAASEEEGIEAGEANVGKGKALLVPCNAIPSLDKLILGGMRRSVVPPPTALAEAKHTPSSSQSKPLFDLNEKAPENEEEEAVQAEPTPHRALNSFNVKEVAPKSFNVKEMAMAAAEAARVSTSALQMLPLFPSAKASSSPKMPPIKKPRTKRRPRMLQFFNNGGKKRM